MSKTHQKTSTVSVVAKGDGKKGLVGLTVRGTRLYVGSHLYPECRDEVAVVGRHAWEIPVHKETAAEQACVLDNGWMVAAQAIRLLGIVVPPIR